MWPLFSKNRPMRETNEPTQMLVCWKSLWAWLYFRWIDRCANYIYLKWIGVSFACARIKNYRKAFKIKVKHQLEQKQTTEFSEISQHTNIFESNQICIIQLEWPLEVDLFIYFKRIFRSCMSTNNNLNIVNYYILLDLTLLKIVREFGNVSIHFESKFVEGEIHVARHSAFKGLVI